MSRNDQYAIIIASMIIFSGMLITVVINRIPQNNDISVKKVRDQVWIAYDDNSFSSYDSDELKVIFVKLKPDGGGILIRVEYRPEEEYYGRDATQDIQLKNNGYGVYTGNFLGRKIEIIL